jgi:hypothetical protein
MKFILCFMYASVILIEQCAPICFRPPVHIVDCSTKLTAVAVHR